MGHGPRTRVKTHGKWNTADALRSTPHRSPERHSTRWKRDVFSRLNALAVGIQHRKPRTAKASTHLDNRLKRLARHDVAAQAGIQRAHTSQPPLTHHPYTMPERKGHHSLHRNALKHCVQQTTARTPKHAPLGAQKTGTDRIRDES